MRRWDPLDPGRMVRSQTVVDAVRAVLLLLVAVALTGGSLRVLGGGGVA